MRIKEANRVSHPLLCSPFRRRLWNKLASSLGHVLSASLLDVDMHTSTLQSNNSCNDAEKCLLFIACTRSVISSFLYDHHTQCGTPHAYSSGDVHCSSTRRSRLLGKFSCLASPQSLPWLWPFVTPHWIVWSDHRWSRACAYAYFKSIHIMYYVCIAYVYEALTFLFVLTST